MSKKDKYRSSNCMWDFIDTYKEYGVYNKGDIRWIFDLPLHPNILIDSLKWMVENTTQYNQKEIDEMLVVLGKVRNVMSENI